DGKHGRLYRITWAGAGEDAAIARRAMDSWARFGKMLPDGLFKALDSDDFSDRLRAQQQLARFGGNPVRDKLLDLVGESKNAAKSRIAAMGALNQLWNDEVHEEFRAQLYAGEPEVRRLAAEGMALNCKAADMEADRALLQVVADQNLAA